jgi:GDP-L-fucose synthase
MASEMEQRAKIFIADHHGLAGSAIRNRLKAQGFQNIISDDLCPGLTDGAQVDEFFARLAPEYVFLIGGKAGGIHANQHFPADLMLDNLLVTCHVIESARRHGVKKLLYLGSSCAYPKFCDQPMRVQALMTGKLEPTNEAYATAKLAGLALCQAYRQQFSVNFISAIPANMFGPGDDFSEEDSHVVGALIRRIHEAARKGDREVAIWGSGSPRREFIFAPDLADCCLFLMQRIDDGAPINIGVGHDWSIRELAEMIKEVVGYRGGFKFDTSKPDGMPAKLLDSSRLRELGWRPRTSIREGLLATYQWYLQQLDLVAGGGDDRAVL